MWRPLLGPVVAAGLRIGSIDLPANKAMMSPDKGKRAEAIAQNAEHIRACAAHGSMNHFVVMLPERPDLPRRESFGYMVESFGELVPVLEANNARLVIEGYPGPGALCCTPEADRAFFKELPSKALGLNYDPSHLIRQNIDPLAFLREFGDRVYHIHGKDAVILTENLLRVRQRTAAHLRPAHALCGDGLALYDSRPWYHSLGGGDAYPCLQGLCGVHLYRA